MGRPMPPRRDGQRRKLKEAGALWRPGCAKRRGRQGDKGRVRRQLGQVLARFGGWGRTTCMGASGIVGPVHPPLRRAAGARSRPDRPGHPGAGRTLRAACSVLLCSIYSVQYLLHRRVRCFTKVLYSAFCETRPSAHARANVAPASLPTLLSSPTWPKPARACSSQPAPYRRCTGPAGQSAIFSPRRGPFSSIPLVSC